MSKYPIKIKIIRKRKSAFSLLQLGSVEFGIDYDTAENFTNLTNLMILFTNQVGFIAYYEKRIKLFKDFVHNGGIFED